MSFFEQRGLFRAVPGGAFVATNAVVCGYVTLGEDSTVWFGSVLRGDDAPIVIGRRSNVQDLTMLHPDPDVPMVIGEEVTIGHRCVLHGARVADRSLIGMGAILLAGSVVGEEAVVAAGAVVREGFEVPPRTLVAGVPARIIREIDEEAVRFNVDAARMYVEKVRQYLGDPAAGERR